MFADALTAIMALGLPTAALTWLVLAGLFDRGELDPGADDKALRKDMKARQKRKASAFLESHLMKFGGGFYGACALWTLLVVEARDLYGLVFDFPGFEALFAGGPGGFISDLIRNQIQNLLDGLLWFNYWNPGQVPLSFLVGYLGYALGAWAARRVSRRRVLALLGLGGSDD